MKRLILLLLSISFGAHAQLPQLSKQATLSVLTLGPWDGELYTAFGHSAFRVHDPEQNVDEVYNYGVFDFDRPNFYLNFARGYLYYQLGVQDYNRFLRPYVYFNRYVHEQVLNLDDVQKQKLYAYLIWNAQPENENYRYDYFYNNCATKIRDVVIAALGNTVKFNGEYITTDYTIRELTDLYLTPQPWGDLGIDICLGLPMDKKASPHEYMFLPDYVESSFDHALIKRGNSWEPIVKQKIVVYEERDEEPLKGLPHPAWPFSIVAALALVFTILDVRRKKLTTWFDALLFAVTGSIGLLLFLLWVATDHQAAAYNFNILWALPTHLVAVLAFIKQPRWLKTYFRVTFIILVLLLLTWPILPQQLNYALVPIVVALGSRAFAQYYVRGKTTHYGV